MTLGELNAALVAARRDRDPRARARVIESYLPLVQAIARRFAGRGERHDDLVQVGAVGVIRAVDRCDPARAEQLTAYTARYVEGEIRRHLRDRALPVRVPRPLQQDAAVMSAAAATQPIDDAADALAPATPPDELGVARALVAAGARTLDRRERHAVALRYFLDLSQAEVGAALGVSQVHAGRVLHQALGKMRTALAYADGSDSGTL